MKFTWRWRRFLPVVFLVTVVVGQSVLWCLCLRVTLPAANRRTPNSYLTVQEIYQQPQNVQKLYSYLLGYDCAHYQNLYAAAATGLRAEHFAFSRHEKGFTQDLQVVFGGLTWQACCLSLTTATDTTPSKPILTLMLAESPYLSVWQHWAVPSSTALASNDYDYSYLRVVALNNGGQLATAPHATTMVVPNAQNMFAIFTMPEVPGAVTDVIVKPAAVAWQQEATFTLDADSARYKNEFWQNATQTAAWRNDYLWLPSYTEVGEIDADKIGFWHLSKQQCRANTGYWLRSGTYWDDYGAVCLSAYGLRDYDTVTQAGMGFRPCLHLDLSAPALRALNTPLK